MTRGSRAVRLCAAIAMSLTTIIAGARWTSAAPIETRPAERPIVAEMPSAMRLARDADGVVRDRPTRWPGDVVGTATTSGSSAALRAFVRDSWHISLPTSVDAQALPPGAPAGTLHYGTAAGDIDGDRLADTLDVELDSESSRIVSLTARRGTDARRLWSRRYGAGIDAVPLPVGDVTGDKNADVLVVRFVPGVGAGADTCATGGCYEAGRVTYAWTFTLISGPKGGIAWARTFEGEGMIGVISPSQAEATFVRGTNALVLPILASDHDRDGRKDVIFNALDIAVAEERVSSGMGDLFADATAAQSIVATRAEVASGDTGKTIFARSQPPTAGAAFLLPARDAVGDAHGDLLWEVSVAAMSPVACVAQAQEGVCGWAEHGRLDLEMIDGETLETAWTSSVEGFDLAYAFAVPADVDLSGDRNTDLFLSEIRSNVALGAISGANGDVLWTVPIEPDAVVATIGKGAGDSGHDLLVSWFVVAAQPTEDHPKTPLHVELHQSRLDGRTSRLHLHTVRTFADNRTRSIQAIETFVFGDSDGDGAGDFVVNRLDADTDINDLVSSSFVESGRTGSQLWSRTAVGFATTRPAGQAAPGVGATLLDLRTDNDDMRTSAVDVSRGRELWSRTDPVADAFATALTSDQSGSGGDDQILSRMMASSQRLLSRIDGIEGRTGAIAWGAGHTLPVRPRGKVIGTVRGVSGRPLTDMCVIAYTSDVRPAGFAATTTKGTYELSGLKTGRYKLQFYDCARTGYVTRWYHQKSSFESADFVRVTDGRTTARIDATLRR